MSRHSYYILGGEDQYPRLMWYTCKEQAWEEAPSSLQAGQFLVEVPERFRDIVGGADLKGYRLYDSTQMHFIGSVVSYKDEKGRTNYLDPLNPDFS